MLSPEQPQVSVIVSAHNVAPTIGKTMEAIHEGVLRLHSRAEIIVVDDASDDETLDVARSRSLELGPAEVLARPTRGGPNASRNTGAIASSGATLIFVDGDDRPFPDWATRLVEAVEHADVIAGGVYVGEASHDRRMPLTNEPPLAFGYPFALGGAMAMSRRVFDLVDGFDENILRGGTEVEFCVRAQALFGVGVVLTPSALVAHREERSPLLAARASFQRQKGLHYVRESLRRQGVPLPGPFTGHGRLSDRRSGARVHGWFTEGALVLGRNVGRVSPKGRTSNSRTGASSALLAE